MEFIYLQSGGGDISFLIPMALIFLVMWFFMIRPQQKKQKEQISFQDQLEKGKEVVTSSGILGKVNKIEDEIITLEVNQKTFIRVTKNAISKELTEAIYSAK